MGSWWAESSLSAKAVPPRPWHPPSGKAGSCFTLCSSCSCLLTLFISFPVHFALTTFSVAVQDVGGMKAADNEQPRRSSPQRCLPGRAPRFLLPPPLPPPASALTPVMCCLFPDKSQLAAPAPKHSGFGSGLSSAAPLETGSLQFIPRKLRLRQQLLGMGLGGLCQAWVRRDFPTPQGEQEFFSCLCPSRCVPPSSPAGGSGSGQGLLVSPLCCLPCSPAVGSVGKKRLAWKKRSRKANSGPGERGGLGQKQIGAAAETT